MNAPDLIRTDNRQVSGQRSFANWDASLRLAFAQRNGQTYPTVREHVGPLRALRGFSAPPGFADCFEQIIVHPPGGIAAGDRLTIDLIAGQDTHTIFTSPGATKWYRTVQDNHPRIATQQTTIRVGHNASVEWLPMENIVFNTAHAQLSMSVDLDSDASFIGADMVCLGRPANHETFDAGEIRMRTAASRNECLIFNEQFLIGGSDPALRARAGLNGASCFATLLIVPQSPDEKLLRELCETIREALNQDSTTEQVTITALEHLLVLRWFGAHAEHGWRVLRNVWRIARPAINCRDSIDPRIWRC